MSSSTEALSHLLHWNLLTMGSVVVGFRAQSRHPGICAMHCCLVGSGRTPGGVGAGGGAACAPAGGGGRAGARGAAGHDRMAGK